jgi:DNA-binding transcriptional LysR family regulator
MVAPEGLAPDAVPVRNEVLGSYPLDLIVRAGHPLLSEAHHEEKFPLLLSSNPRDSGVASTGQIHPSAGSSHVINDFPLLAQIVRATDAIWLATNFAVLEGIRGGTLRNLPHMNAEIPRWRKIVMYSLRGRSRSPGAVRLKEMFILRLRELEGLIS